MKKENYQYNVLGLGEAFLENNARLLLNVKQMVIQEIDRDNKLVNEHIFNKDELPIKLLEIFDNGVSHLKEIKIVYIEHGLRQNLTEIEIFK